MIQAEGINPSTTSTMTVLSSVTSTTTVNTSPISTNIVPILKSDVDQKSPVTKHVTFKIQASNSTLQPNPTVETTAVTSSNPPSLTCSSTKSSVSSITGFNFPSSTAVATSAPTSQVSSILGNSNSKSPFSTAIVTTSQEAIRPATSPGRKLLLLRCFFTDF